MMQLIPHIQLYFHHFPMYAWSVVPFSLPLTHLKGPSKIGHHRYTFITKALFNIIFNFWIFLVASDLSRGWVIFCSKTLQCGKMTQKKVDYSQSSFIQTSFNLNLSEMLWCKSWQIMIFYETLKDFPIGDCDMSQLIMIHHETSKLFQ